MIRARIVSTALDTAMAIALVRMLPKQQFAILGVAFVAYELAKQLAVGGFADSLLVLLPTAREGARRALAWRTARLLIATGAVASLVTLLIAATADLWLDQWQPADRALLSRVLGLFAVICLLEFPTLPLTQLLLASNRQIAAGRWEVVTSVVTLIALLGPIAFGFGVLGAALALTCWSGMRMIVAFLIARLVLPPATEALPEGSLREQLSFAIPLGVHTLISRLNKHADKMIVTVLMPAAALAEYAAASHELPFVTLFPYVVGSVLASRYALAFERSEPETVVRLWNAGTRKVALAVVPAAIWSIVSAPELILLAFGPNYLGAVVPFRIFSAVLLLRVAQFGAVLQAARDTRSILKFGAVTATANIVLGVLLTPIFGIAGTAGATLMSNLIGLVLYTRRIARHFQSTWTSVLPVAHWLRIVGASCASGTAALALRHWLQPTSPALSLALQTCVFVMLLAALYRTIGLWGASETRALRLVLGC